VGFVGQDARGNGYDAAMQARLWGLAYVLATCGCYVGVEGPVANESIGFDVPADGFGGEDASTGGAGGPGDDSDDSNATQGSGADSASGGYDSGDGPSGGDSTAGDGTSGGDPYTTGDDSLSTSAGPGDSGDASGGTTGGSDVPSNAYCDPVSNWSDPWAAHEWEILELVNQERAQGANCGSEGSFGPAAPLAMNPALRCAARRHSEDMEKRDFFDHTNPSGEKPWDRMDNAGYDWTQAGENIAWGNSTASATMDQWMTSDGHCANIMNPDFEEIGVGYYPGGSNFDHLWTQVFGTQ
jgi:uncharacterized protein YkwD